MLKQTITILECSRIFSLPMTILSWLIVFTYAVIDSGNILYGLIALIGLCLAHLGSNLIDDFFDYKFLIKQVDFDKAEYLKNSQKTKCRYLINGIISEKQLLTYICIYFSLAALCGLFLYIKCGVGVAYFAFIGALIGLIYPIASRFYLSEVLIALAFGPALFGGVYYVMTGTYSNDVFMLTIPSMLMTVVLLYIHSVMDFDFDTNEGKRTVANSFNSQLDSLVVLKYLLIVAYLSIFLICIFDIADWQVFGTYITIPLAIDLYKSMELFSTNPEEVPQRRWYHFPMEGLDAFAKRGEASFMMRMLQARNLMIYFSLFFIVGLIISLGV